MRTEPVAAKSFVAVMIRRFGTLEVKRGHPLANAVTFSQTGAGDGPQEGEHP